MDLGLWWRDNFDMGLRLLLCLRKMRLMERGLGIGLHLGHCGLLLGNGRLGVLFGDWSLGLALGE